MPTLVFSAAFSLLAPATAAFVLAGTAERSYRGEKASNRKGGQTGRAANLAGAAVGETERVVCARAGGRAVPGWAGQPVVALDGHLLFFFTPARPCAAPSVSLAQARSHPLAGIRSTLNGQRTHTQAHTHTHTQRPMDVPLGEDQQRELDRSVVEYVRWRCGSSDRAGIGSELARALQVAETPGDASRPLLLPRKWTSIVRLQRRIMALEQTCRELRELNAAASAAAAAAEASAAEAPDASPHADASRRRAWLPAAQPHSAITVESPVTSVALHPELALVFVATEHGRLHCFDLLDTSIPMASVQAHTRAVTSVDCVCVGGCTYVATGSKDMQARVFTWDASAGLRLLRSFQGHEHVVSGVRLWLKGNDLLIASCSRDTFVKIWDVLQGWCLKSFQPHADWVRCLDVQGEYVLTGAQDATLRLTHWPSGNGLSVGVGHSFPIESVAFVPGTQAQETKWFGQCVSASRDRTAKIWSIPAPRQLPHRDPVPHSPDAQFHCKITLDGHQSWVRCVRVRGPHVFTSSDDRSVKCWELATGNCARTWHNVHQGFVSCIDLDGTDHPLQRRIAVTGGIDCKCHIFMQ